jgi:hypothetical protein
LVRVRLGGRHERMQYVHIHYSTTHTVSDASTTHLVLLTQGSAPSCRCARRSCTLAARCASSSAPGPDAAVASSSSSCVSTHREGKQARAWEPVSMRVSRRRCHLGPARARRHAQAHVGGRQRWHHQPAQPAPPNGRFERGDPARREYEAGLSHTPEPSAERWRAATTCRRGTAAGWRRAGRRGRSIPGAPSPP